MRLGGRPSKQLRYRVVRQRVELDQLPIVRDQKSLALFLQGCHRNLPVAAFPGGLNGGVDTP